MQVAVLTGPGRLDLVEHPEPPSPGPGEVLVAVRRVGICGTDYHAYSGTQNFISYPCVLGHELAVEVLEIGPRVYRLRPGDLCAVMPYLACDRCVACVRGRPNCCERIQVLGVTRPGGLRERMVLPAVKLFHNPDLTLDQLVLIETLGIGWHAVARASPKPQDSVLVLGAGPIGLAVAQSARRQVERIVIADISPDRVEFAAGTGLDAVVVNDDFDQVLHDRSDGVLPSLVFDASGSRASMEAAFGLVGSGGTLVFVGHTTSSLSFQNPPFHARELDLRASRNATADDWAQVMTAVAEGGLDAVGWVNQRSTLSAVVEDLPRLAARPGQIIKAVVDIEPASDGSSRT